MICTVKATVERGVPKTLHLLNVTVAYSSNLILDVDVDAIISNFGDYDAPKEVDLSELQCTQPVDSSRNPAEATVSTLRSEPQLHATAAFAMCMTGLERTLALICSRLTVLHGADWLCPAPA